MFYRQLRDVVTPILDSLAAEKNYAETAGNRQRWQLVRSRFAMITHWLVEINSNESRAVLLGLSQTELDRILAEIGDMCHGLLHSQVWPTLVRELRCRFQ